MLIRKSKYKFTYFPKSNKSFKIFQISQRKSFNPKPIYNNMHMELFYVKPNVDGILWC